MTITNFTISGYTYTSYASVQEADSFLLIDEERKAAWAVLNDQVKMERLAYATRVVDGYQPFSGDKFDKDQATEFPRDGLQCNGSPFPTQINALPEDIVNATILLAGTFTVSPAAATMAGQQATSQVRRIRAGEVEIENFHNNAIYLDNLTHTAVPDLAAHNLILCYQENAVGTGEGTIGQGYASGTDGESAFDDPRRFGIDGGYEYNRGRVDA